MLIYSRPPAAVKAGKQNQVYLVLFHVLQHPQEVGTLPQPLAGCLCRIDLDANDHLAVFFGVLIQVLLLGLQR